MERPREDDFWLGKIEEHPEIMTQGHTFAELMNNLRDAYRLMEFDDVPTEHSQTELIV